MDRLRKLTTLIMAGGRGERLFPLTREKAKPAVTFGGIYKIIDFTLSNCINSGIRQIYVLTQYGSFSLDHHLRMAWEVVNPEMGEYIYSIPPQQVTVNRWYRGTADSIYQNISILQSERPDYVLILSGDHVYKMNYMEMLNYHIDKRADMTAASVEFPRLESTGFGILHVDEDNRIINFLEKPKDPPGLPGNPDVSLANMGIYIFKTEVLVQEVIRDARLPESDHDFGKNIIPSMVQRAMRVYSYSFRDENKKEVHYWRDIGRIDAFYDANMDLVTIDPVFNLYDPDWPIRTYQRQCPPAKTIFGGDPGHIQAGLAEDTLISNGCIISGATVKRSILSPNVRVDYYAEVCDSILFDDVHIGARARVRRAIIEEGVTVPPGFSIGYDREADVRRFPVSESGVVIVPNNIDLRVE
ncbi:glucose-1-phosphate adenylyltransferase [Desulfobacca acetoxidans]|uniref:Glucose-1-phosphate adenylyltransferase n=1 Tax=Desulfobacca acetoxidans (strain ATCC 700848 / DSM 11109 / ASRB2) TaxID=880072 RepID=F2NHV6_DESAR|nr:glucose-1-phosphate adenylyltransferase [Desulfobacca acetoxidans]AEB09441.1 Glucose-1-phosphate adenylyltransferase [Desulfobacca acetoxidans DSM 11109]HAY23238.1 glucose-1-phosphate adenylyltransferase [Desulfobacterales bacterium]